MHLSTYRQGLLVTTIQPLYFRWFNRFLNFNYTMVKWPVDNLYLQRKKQNTERSLPVLFSVVTFGPLLRCSYQSPLLALIQRFYEVFLVAIRCFFSCGVHFVFSNFSMLSFVVIGRCLHNCSSFHKGSFLSIEVRNHLANFKFR